MKPATRTRGALEHASATEDKSRSPNTDRLTSDDIFEALCNPRRREIIEFLLGEGGVTTQSALAEHIAAKENDKPIPAVSSYERKRVYIGLYQNHLPKLDSLRIISYDKARGTIHLCDTVSQLEPFLDTPIRREDPRVDILVASSVSVIVLLGIFEVGVLAVVPRELWILLGVGSLLGLVGLHRYWHGQ